MSSHVWSDSHWSFGLLRYPMVALAASWKHNFMLSQYWLLSALSSKDKVSNLFRISSLKAWLNSLTLSFSESKTRFKGAFFAFLLLLNLRRIFVAVRLWSDPMSAPLCSLISSRLDLLFLLQRQWSIWFRVWPSGDIQEYVCRSWLENRVPPITKSLRSAKSISSSHFMLWYVVCYGIESSVRFVFWFACGVIGGRVAYYYWKFRIRANKAGFQDSRWHQFYSSRAWDVCL
jgi:hypothetical protein